jgi:adenosylmethionine-8-amino-7-oxononanoate aminotransferase
MSDAVAEVMLESGQAWMHAYTYSAHPVGCAVALAMLDIVEGEDFPGQAAAKGKRLLDGLRRALGDHPNVGDVRGLGLMCGIEYVQDRATKTPFDAAEKVGPRIHAAGLERGLFSRTRGDVYQIAPPIVTSEESIDRCVDIIAEATKAVLG